MQTSLDHPQPQAQHAPESQNSPFNATSNGSHASAHSKPTAAQTGGAHTHDTDENSVFEYSPISLINAQYITLGTPMLPDSISAAITWMERLGEEYYPDARCRQIATALKKAYLNHLSGDSENGIDFRRYVAEILKEEGHLNEHNLLIERIIPASARYEIPFENCVQRLINAHKAAEVKRSFPLDEIGNGKRFAAENRADMRYCTVREKWLIYKDGCYQPDNHGEAERRAKLISLAVAGQTAHETNDDRRSRLLKHAQTLTKRATRETMLKDAASEDGISVTPEQFDADLNLLNLANGTVDLENRVLLPHDPRRLLSLQSPIAFDAEADCPTWRRCMARWIPDEATRDYLQEAIGVTLSGKVFDEFFVFLFGDGDNGKSTFLRVLEWLMGSYWHKTQAETIMQARDQRQANAPAPEKLALKGARLVTVHEIDRKHTLNAPLIKDLTGRDAITARGLFEKRPTTFQPQFTLWMFGNGKPQIKDTSGGMWRRPRLIDFGQPIPLDERDPHLGDKLKAELPGILNWALEGLARVQERGLVVPDAVRAATADYRAEQDALSGFIKDHCVIGSQCTVSVSELWTAWCKWCTENSEREGTQRALGVELSRRKYEAYEGSSGRRRRGIGLKAPTQPTEPSPNPEKVSKENSYARDFNGNCDSSVGCVGAEASTPNREKVVL